MQKNILITGCSSGIGYCCATGLAKRGWRVLASCRRPEDVERLQQQGLECLQIDVADSASLRRGAEAALALCDGRLDALFNNAGYGQPGAAEDISREVLRAQFETNLFGAWELTNLLLPAMRAQGHGMFVAYAEIATRSIVIYK